MKNAIQTAGRWLKVLAYLPAAAWVVWREVDDEIKKERYERGEI